MSAVRTRSEPRAAPTPQNHQGEVLGCTIAPHGKWGASVGSDGMLFLWEGNPDQAVRGWRVGDKAVLSVAISPDGGRILTGSLEGLLSQWDVQTQRRLSVFLAHSRPISSITFSPDATRFATTSWDNSIVVWRSTGEPKGTTFSGHTDIVAGCRFMPDGKRLFSWSHDGSLRIWDVLWSRAGLNWQGHSDRILAGDVSPDGRWLASAGKDGNVILWDAGKGQEIARHSDPKSEFRACLFSADAQRLFTVSANGEILTHTLPGFHGSMCEETGLAIQCAALSPCGGEMVLGTSEGDLRAVNLPGVVEQPICATPYETEVNRPGFFARLLKKEQFERVLHLVCPMCGHDHELKPDARVTTCPGCRRALAVNEFFFAERPGTTHAKAAAAVPVVRRPTFYPTPPPEE